MDNAIELSELTKYFGAKMAVDGLKLVFGKGRLLGFIGKNGAGKTTTIKMLMGLLKPTSGNGKLLGLDIVTDSISIRKKVGYLPETSTPPSDFTVTSYLKYIGLHYGLPAPVLESRIEELLEMVGMSSAVSVKCGHLSKGMRQRLNVACALIHSPEMIIFDEPTTGLDPGGRRDMLLMMRTFADKGGTVIFSTHILADVERIADEVAMINEGKLVAFGDIESLKKKHEVVNLEELFLMLTEGHKLSGE
jgi:ABC-2 type transport system ATP-binding protein